MTRESAISRVNRMCTTSSSLMHKTVEHVAEAGHPNYKGNHLNRALVESWSFNSLGPAKILAYSMWYSYGRPREDHVYTYYKYKLAKKAYTDMFAPLP